MKMLVTDYLKKTENILLGNIIHVKRNGGNSLHKLLFLVIMTIILASGTAAARLDYEHGRTVNELEDIFEILRENQASSAADDGSKWSDAVDAWISDTQEKSIASNYGSTNGQNQQISVTRESIWKLWNGLLTGTRELVIKKLYPLLIPQDTSERLNWRLHCADAYKLCMADTNCYWKYTNFLSSCTDRDLSILDDMESEQKSSEYFNDDILDKTEKSRRRRSPRRRANRRHHRTNRRGVKRDVYKVERKMRKEARAIKRRKRTQRRKSVYWMGQYFVPEKYQDPYSVLRYFSMKTRSSKCSTKCVHSLMMLNETVYGALLAHCDCRAKTMPSAYHSSGPIIRKNQFSSSSTSQTSQAAQEEYLESWEKTCFVHQQAAQTCRPRVFSGTPDVIGCTEARQRCEKSSICRKAQQNFLSKCSQVINGLRCSTSCQESVRRLREITTHYDTCICDTSEGPTCRQIRSNVVRLCNIELEERGINFQSSSKQFSEQNSNNKKYLTPKPEKTLSEIHDERHMNISNSNSTNIFNLAHSQRTFSNSNNNKDKNNSFSSATTIFNVSNNIMFIFQLFVLKIFTFTSD